MDFDTDIKPKLNATARWVMALLAGYLVQHGLLANSVGAAFTDAGVAALLAVGAIVWSFIQKELQKKQVQEALATPVVGTMTVEDAAAKLLPAILNALPQAPPSSAVAPTVTVEAVAPGASVSPPAPLTATPPDPNLALLSPTLSAESTAPNAIFKPAGLP